VPADVLAQVKAKQRQDDQQIASLSARGVAVAPIRTGRDGGMHPTFLAKLKPQEVREADGTVRYVVDKNAASQLGSYVNPPLETYPDAAPTGTAIAATAPATPAPKAKQDQKGGSTYVTAASDSRATPAPSSASSLFATTADSRSEGVFGRMKTSMGRWFGGDEEKPVPSAPAAAAKPAPAPKPAARPQATAAKQQPAQQAQDAEPPAQAASAPTPARQSAASGASLMNGATPTVPTGAFDQRWGAIR
jgi:hypothetical protein